MPSQTSWNDIVAYHHEQCHKHVAVVRYYLQSEKDFGLRDCFKQVLHAMINQHEEYLKKCASARNMDYAKIDLNWIKDLHKRINSLHASYTSS